MKIVVLSGSTRRSSLNTSLAALVARVRPDDEVVVRNELAALPFYDADLEARGTPLPVASLRHEIDAADALVVATPEYNGTVPGVLGNAFDWLSRPHGQSVLLGKQVLVLSASPSRFGAVRAAAQVRAVLGTIGSDVLPDGLGVARAHERLRSPDDELLAELRVVTEQLVQRRVATDVADRPRSAA